MKITVQGSTQNFPQGCGEEHTPHAELLHALNAAEGSSLPVHGGLPVLAAGFRCRQIAYTRSLELLTFRAWWKAGIGTFLLLYERAL